MRTYHRWLCALAAWSVLGGLGAPRMAAARPEVVPLADQDLPARTNGKRFRNQEEQYEVTIPSDWKVQRFASGLVSLSDTRYGSANYVGVSTLDLDGEPDEEGRRRQLAAFLNEKIESHRRDGGDCRVFKHGTCGVHSMPAVWATSHCRLFGSSTGQIDVLVFHERRRFCLTGSTSFEEFSNQLPMLLGIIGSLTDLR